MKASDLKHRLLGVGFIVIVAALVALSIAMYNKAFTTYTMVTLQTDKVGNQLQVLGDVKVNGLIVGQIRDIKPTEKGAELRLALDPDKAELVPSNVTAQFIPKTLFGDRYVALQIPADRSGRALRDGDLIMQDTSKRAIELSSALDNLLPVLQAVQPAKLSSTLTSISTALQGRGGQLGDTITQLGELVAEVNPSVPQLQKDLAMLADVSDTYNEAAPELVAALTDVITTSKTLAEQRVNLDTLYASLTTTSRDAESFLRANRENIIQLVDTLRPTAELLARYSPEYPCFLTQMASLVDPANEAFGRGINQPGLKAKIKITVNRGKYEVDEDTPQFDEHRGPRCYNPEAYCVPFPEQPPEGPLKDGTSQTPSPDPSCDKSPPPVDSTIPSSMPSQLSSAGLGPANSPGEGALLAQLLSGELDVAPSQVPAWSGLLVGPVYRGAGVVVQ